MSIPYYYPIKETSDTNKKEKQVKGILSFIDGELLFEYKVYDEHGNSLSNLSKFSIQLENIHRMQFKKGFLFSGSKLIIEAKKGAFLEPLPGSKQGEISMNIKRNDREEAIRFSGKMNLYMSQQHLDETDEE